MTGKRNSSGESKDCNSGASSSNDSSESKNTANKSKNPPKQESIPNITPKVEETSTSEEPSPLQCLDPSSGLQLVPVHITGADYSNPNVGYIPYSNSNVYNQSKYYGDRGSVPYQHHNPQHQQQQQQHQHNNRYQQYRHPVPNIPVEQMNQNIQKNLEHRAQQKRQEVENIIRNNNEANQFLSRGSIIVRMRGLPYDCTAKQVVEFFKNGENGVQLLESEDGVLFVRKPDGRATGDAFVLLSSEEDVTKALLKHRELIGSRYIELFRSTSAEVMNRSMDIRHMEQPTQQMPPLISQLPSIQPMLPQQSVAHGPKKDCIRLRGLPFEAHIENVLSFLGEYSQHIMYRGVHMVYTPQGQPSGEAFIQMTSESAAWNCTQNRHKRYMTSVNVGKPRYIDVFQCSGDDMNLVLSGGALPVVPSVAATTPTRPIVHSPSGMFVWDNGAPTGAPPLLLPSQPQSPHIQSPALHHHHHTSLPPPIHHPPPPAGFLPQGHPAAAAAAAAAAAMAGGVRPPFPPGLGLAPQALLAPPSNGIMLPTIHPSLKQQPQVLLPPPMSSTSRQPIEVSMSQVSHGMQMQPIKTTAVSSPAGYPMFTYQTPSTSTALTAASSAGMYLIPNHNPKLAAPLTSIPHHMLFPPFTQTHTPSVTSTPNPEPSSTNKPPPVHLLPTPYGSAIPNQRRVPQAAPQTQSVTSKRSYDQAFPGDRSGQGSSSGSSGGGSSKRMAAAAPSTSHFSSSTPISHPAPLPFSQAAHYPPPHPSQFAALANQPPLAHAFNPHLAPAAAAAAAAANPMTGHLLHPLYPPPMYPQM